MSLHPLTHKVLFSRSITVTGRRWQQPNSMFGTRSKSSLIIQDQTPTDREYEVEESKVEEAWRSHASTLIKPPIPRKTVSREELQARARKETEEFNNTIKKYMTCSKFRDSVWGFVIYRCSKDHQGAWDRLLKQLRDAPMPLPEAAEWSLDDRGDPELIDAHDVQVIDDETLYGATHHQVREHFRSWVPKDLKNRLQPNATDLDQDMGYCYASSTPRYKYCLMADDICLESLDQSRTSSHVVKIISKDWVTPWPLEVTSDTSLTTPEPFHDGYSEDDWEEDVGWMYMELSNYENKYYELSKFDWDDLYVRPPYIDGFEDETTFVGHWRKAKPRVEETQDAKE